MSGNDLNETASRRKGRSPLVILGGVILLGLALALLIFGNNLLGSDTTSSSFLQQIPAFNLSQTGAVQSGGPLQAGDPARDFALNDVDGNPVHLSDFSGRPVILNFWATWCGPCRIEMPDLQAAYDSHQTDGLVILALNREEPADTVRTFFYDEMDLTFTPLLDAEGNVARLYHVANYPTSYFIAPDGMVTAVHLGLMTEGQIEGYLAGTITNEG